MSLRELPQVDVLLREIEALVAVGPRVGRWIARRELASARARLLRGEDGGDVRAACAAAADALRTRAMRPVINATGVVLHTNLGRAPLSAAAIDAVRGAAGPVALEYDLASGARAERAPVAARLAAALCDAEDALVVNNNAAALVLLLAALAGGRDVLVARGELIEIGGGFRLPEVMAASGARLREVGTTNRTRAADFTVDDASALVLKVHPSNYEITGFTASPTVAELAEVARAASIPFAFDIGSGLLAPDPRMPAEPDATSALDDGADLVCFSGDKMLGGPQAGIIAGRADLVEACRRHPLARAVRADKLSLAALEATLWAHARGEEVPVTAMIGADAQTLQRRAEALASTIAGATVEQGDAVPGGGSLPGVTLPTFVVTVAEADPDALATGLRAGDPPIIARVAKDRLIIDLRTVAPADDARIAAALMGR